MIIVVILGYAIIFNMENIKPQQSEKVLLDSLAMDFQNLAVSFQEKGAGEDMYTLVRTLIVTLQRLGQSNPNEFKIMREYIKEESCNIKELLHKAMHFSTETELENIKKEMNELSIHIQHKGNLDYLA